MVLSTAPVHRWPAAFSPERLLPSRSGVVVSGTPSSTADFAALASSRRGAVQPARACRASAALALILHGHQRDTPPPPFDTRRQLYTATCLRRVQDCRGITRRPSITADWPVAAGQADVLAASCARAALRGGCRRLHRLSPRRRCVAVAWPYSCVEVGQLHAVGVGGPPSPSPFSPRVGRCPAFPGSRPAPRRLAGAHRILSSWSSACRRVAPNQFRAPEQAGRGRWMDRPLSAQRMLRMPFRSPSHRGLQSVGPVQRGAHPPRLSSNASRSVRTVRASRRHAYCVPAPADLPPFRTFPTSSATARRTCNLALRQAVAPSFGSGPHVDHRGCPARDA